MPRMLLEGPGGQPCCVLGTGLHRLGDHHTEAQGQPEVLGAKVRARERGVQKSAAMGTEAPRGALMMLAEMGNMPGFLLNCTEMTVCVVLLQRLGSGGKVLVDLAQMELTKERAMVTLLLCGMVQQARGPGTSMPIDKAATAMVGDQAEVAQAKKNGLGKVALTACAMMAGRLVLMQVSAHGVDNRRLHPRSELQRIRQRRRRILLRTSLLCSDDISTKEVIRNEFLIESGEGKTHRHEKLVVLPVVEVTTKCHKVAAQIVQRHLMKAEHQALQGRR